MDTASQSLFFTTLKINNLKPLALKRHLDKFESFFKEASLKPPQVSLELLHTLISKSCQKEGCYRLNIKMKTPNQVYFEIRPYFEENKTYSLKIYPTPFVEERAHVKKMAFSERLKKLELAKQSGCDDWIFCNQRGAILETCIANLFWIKEKKLVYPSPSLPYYQGVTLEATLESAKHLGYCLEEVQASSTALFEGCRLYLCNSMKGICQVSQLDGKELPLDQKEFLELKMQYNEIINREDGLWPSL